VVRGARSPRSFAARDRPPTDGSPLWPRPPGLRSPRAARRRSRRETPTRTAGGARRTPDRAWVCEPSLPSNWSNQEPLRPGGHDHVAQPLGLGQGDPPPERRQPVGPAAVGGRGGGLTHQAVGQQPLDDAVERAGAEADLAAGAMAWVKGRPVGAIITTRALSPASPSTPSETFRTVGRGFYRSRRDCVPLSKATVAEHRASCWNHTETFITSLIARMLAAAWSVARH